MYINWFGMILGLYFLSIYFFVKMKHKLGFVLYGECLRKAKDIKNRSRLESDISTIQLIFGIALIIGSVIEANILIDTLAYIIGSFYVFRLLYIRKKVLQGLYD